MNSVPIRRGDIWWVSLDPSQGAEIRKTRPCLVLTHNSLNRHRRTVVVLPLSTAASAHPPITIPVRCADQDAVVIVDQIRTVRKHRLQSRMGAMAKEDLAKVEHALKAILEMK